MIGALGKAVSKLDDLAPLTKTVSKVDTTNGVVKLSTTQMEHMAKRGQRLQQLDSTLQTQKADIEAYTEVKADPANLAKLSEDNPAIGDLVERYPDQPKKVESRLKDRAKKTSEKQSSERSNVEAFTPEDPKTFRTKEAVQAKQQEEVARGLTKGSLEQHHLLAKGPTGAFMNHADILIAKGKATPELLIEMVNIAKKKTGATRGRATSGGDRLSNMLNMQTVPHNQFHTEMELQGIIESKQAWEKKLSKIESGEELIKKWEDWLDTDGVYTKDTAEIWEELGELLEQVRAS